MLIKKKSIRFRKSKIKQYIKVTLIIRSWEIRSWIKKQHQIPKQLQDLKKLLLQLASMNYLTYKKRIYWTLKKKKYLLILRAIRNFKFHSNPLGNTLEKDLIKIFQVSINSSNIKVFQRNLNHSSIC